MRKNAQMVVHELAEQAGITIGGPDGDVQIHHSGFYDRLLAEGTLGLGNMYMEGWWDAMDLGDFFVNVLRSGIRDQLGLNPYIVMQALRARLLNLQNRARAGEVGVVHYDWGNELYSPMLGPSMTYSCGNWDRFSLHPVNLTAAQDAKHDLVCRKIGLKPGDRVLDVGCGWGGFAIYAATHYGASVVGVTISKEQAQWAQAHTAHLPGVDILIMDYRDAAVLGKFNHVISIGAFEHFGVKNYPTFFQVSHRALKPGGLLLLHTIGNNRSVQQGDPWLTEHIFPNSMIPSVQQIGGAAEGLFVEENLHNFGPHYFTTTRAWYHNLMAVWPELARRAPQRYTKSNRRMWEYYLLSCGALFAVRQAQLWQWVMSRECDARALYMPVY